MKSGKRSRKARELFFCALVFTAALAGTRGFATGLPAGAFGFAGAFPAPRLLCQTRFLPLPSAIWSIERPVATDSGSSSRISLPRGPRAASSLLLISSQLSRRSFGRARSRTRCQRPCNFSPSRSKVRCPLASPLCGSPSGVQWPRSQIITVPPPYSPCGMVPSKVLYSTGWSSTWTARRFSPGSRLGPRVTAQLFITPSSSSRRS